MVSAFWKSDAKLESIFICLLAAMLCWVALPFGSNIPAAWGLNAILACGIALALEIALLIGRRPHPVGLAHLAAPAALFGAVVLWILVQEATWTPASWHHPIWGLAADALGRPVKGSISVNRDLTATALVRLVTAASVFWLAIQLCRDEGRAAVLISIVAIAISIYAGLGIAMAVVAPGKVLWLEIRNERGFVTSTFMNRNTFATYAGLGFLINYGLLIDHYRRAVGWMRGPIRYQVASFVDATGLNVAMWIGLALLDFAALSLTGSRGAMIATVFGFATLNALTFARSGWRALGLAVLLVLGVAVIIASGVLDPVLRSLAQRGFYDANRMSVFALVVGGILDEPILGYGYGTFPDVFPMLRDRSVGGFDRWETAHNIYLEVFQELGLVFGAALIACVVLLAWRCGHGALTRHRSAMIPCLGVSAAVLVGVHALVDYSLQVQAITLTFLAILGAGVAQSKSSRRDLDD